MNQFLEDVAEFMDMSGQEIKIVPTFLDFKTTALRVSLMKEELKEIETAIENKDMVELADAYADMMYVTIGGILSFGLGEKFGEIWNEVQRSNMSKKCRTEEIALKTKEYYAEQDIDVYIQPMKDFWVVKRHDNDKVLKSIEWSEPSLEEILISL